MPVTLHWVHKRQSEKGGLWGPPFSLFPRLLQQPRTVIIQPANVDRSRRRAASIRRS